MLESKRPTPPPDTHTTMIKLTAPLLLALSFFPSAHALAADHTENKAEGSILTKNKNTNTESVKLKPKFPISIDTQDSEIKDMIEEHLPLITQQQEEVLDKEQVGFLAEEAPDNVKTMLRSKGYFNSKVSLTEKNGGYTVHIIPGPRTKISNVSVAILGDILSDGNLAEYYRNAMSNWQQPVGSDFNQDDWESSNIRSQRGNAQRLSPGQTRQYAGYRQPGYRHRRFERHCRQQPPHIIRQL